MEEEQEVQEVQEEQEPDIKKKDLQVQQKIYDMILYGYPALEQFPRSQKFSLAQDIKHCMDQVMRLTITANKKYTKRTTLRDLDVEVASLKVYLRMAFDLKYLPPKKYEVWSRMVVEVGKMVGGWIKSQEEPEADPNAEKRYCSDCSAEMPEKAYQYSMKHFGRALCYKCQRKEKGKK